MFKLFYPYEYVDSVFSIDYTKLYAQGYRALIFDIDNTLVHHGDDSTSEIDNLFLHLHKTGFKTLLLSNNDDERVKRFIKNIDTLYICDANKPDTTNYLKAIEILQVKKEEAIFIGDQIFTDILGANRCSIPNILVKFIRLDNNEKIGKRRHLENIILKFYKHNKSFQHRLNNIQKKEDS